MQLLDSTTQAVKLNQICRPKTPRDATQLSDVASKHYCDAFGVPLSSDFPVTLRRCHERAVKPHHDIAIKCYALDERSTNAVVV